MISMITLVIKRTVRYNDVCRLPLGLLSLLLLRTDHYQRQLTR